MNQAQKLNMTYDEIDAALWSEEGLLGYRLRRNILRVEIQIFKDGVWQLLKSEYGKERVFNHARHALREMYKYLRQSCLFSEDCEIHTPKYEIQKYKNEYEKVWQAQKANKIKQTYDLPTYNHLAEDDRIFHIAKMKHALLERVIAFEGDGVIKPYTNVPGTISCIYREKTHYLALADDGNSGPLIVSEDEKDVHFSITGDEEELTVLQQLLVNPWIREPFDI